MIFRYLLQENLDILSLKFDMNKQIYTILTVSLSFGGAERVISILLEEFANRGIDTILIMLGRDQFYKIPSTTKVIYLSNLSGSENPIIKLLYLPLWTIRLKKIIKNYDLEVIQSHLYPANFVNILAKLLGSKHKAFIANRGVISRFQHEGFLRKISILLIRFLYPKADSFVLLTQAMRDDFVKYVNIYKRIYIINNPYNINIINKLKMDVFAEGEFFPNKKKRYIISVGRIINAKNPKLIIKAFGLIATKYNDLDLIFCGQGNLENECKRLAKDLKIASRVHFLGVVSNPFKYMASSCIFVSSSNFEGFPNAMMEALACKLPVVSTDCNSGPREILAPDTPYSSRLENDIELAKYGILIPIGDAKLLAKAIIRLLSDRELYDSYCLNSFKRVKDFSVDKIANQYLSVMSNNNIKQ